MVECDELGHSDRGPEKERARQQFIIDQGYTVIMFNPNQHQFKLSKVIADINKPLLKGKHLKTPTKPQLIDHSSHNDGHSSQGNFKCQSCTHLKQIMQDIVISNLSQEGHAILANIMFKHSFCNKYFLSIVPHHGTMPTTRDCGIVTAAQGLQ